MATIGEFELSEIQSGENLIPSLTGKVVLLVNVASECGYTPQYEGLESLHRELDDQGFAVVGVPCNQFGDQEPGSEAQITRFCRSRFGVSFPMSRKLEVNGAGRDPLYAWLTAPEQGFEGDIQWNFEKFLIGRDGRPVARYPSGTSPQDAGLLQDIADALGAPGGI